MATITKTTNTFTSVEAPVVVSTGTVGTLRTLDLKNKDGAYIHCRIGRQAATALTRAGYVAIRKTDNDSLVIPNPFYDVQTQIVASINTTLSGAQSIGDATIGVASAVGFAVGDTLCLSGASAVRVEFSRIVAISGSVFTLERPLRLAHNSGDAVRSLADIYTQWIPGGDIYEIRCINNSGQDLLFAIDAEVESGYTSV
jgi:hypothetical protein